jgi:hypothetical protein
VLPTKPPNAIEVPFEIVVVCRERDILLHPGGYCLTTKAIAAARGQNLLARELRAMVRKRAIVDPLIRPKPTIKFLVESNGGETFLLARSQLFFALPEWRSTMQVSGAHDPRAFNTGTF